MREGKGKGMQDVLIEVPDEFAILSDRKKFEHSESCRHQDTPCLLNNISVENRGLSCPLKTGLRPNLFTAKSAKFKSQ